MTNNERAQTPKPQDIAGGQEKAGVVVIGPSATSRLMHDVLRSMAEKPAPILLAPASAQDQERPCETCAFAERTGQTCPFHPPAPPIAKAGEPETQVVCTHCGYFATEVPVRPRDEQVVALVTRVQVLEKALREIWNLPVYGDPPFAAEEAERIARAALADSAADEKGKGTR